MEGYEQAREEKNKELQEMKVRVCSSALGQVWPASRESLWTLLP